MAEESMDTKKETNTDKLMIQADTISMGIGKNNKSNSISNNLLAKTDSMVMQIVEKTEQGLKEILIIEMDLKDTGIKTDIEESQVDMEGSTITGITMKQKVDS